MALSDERLKIILEFIKWLIVSVVIALITLIIDSGFKDRAAGVAELSEYSKYVDLITDYNKVAERRLLAQFFSIVTPSEKLREGWEKYYKLVNAEYDSILLETKSISDAIEKLDTTKPAQKLKKTELEIKKRKLENQMTPTFDRRVLGSIEFRPIQPSETLESVSKRYGVPIDELIRLNPDLVEKEIKENNLKDKAIIRIR